VIYLIEKQLWLEDNETQVRSTIGEVVLRLESKSSTFSSSYIVYDRYHVELGAIRKSGFKKSYEIIYDGKVVGSAFLKKKWFSKWFVLTTGKGVEFRVKGNIEKHEYNIMKGRKKVAQIHHKLGSSSKTYGFETIDEENKYVLLCGVLALQIMTST